MADFRLMQYCFAEHDFTTGAGFAEPRGGVHRIADDGVLHAIFRAHAAGNHIASVQTNAELHRWHPAWTMTHRGFDQLTKQAAETERVKGVLRIFMR